MLLQSKLEVGACAGVRQCVNVEEKVSRVDGNRLDAHSCGNST